MRLSSKILTLLSGIAILFLLSGITVFGQQRSAVSGKVTDASGTPLPYASVTIDSLKTGVVCDENGAYQINNIRPGTLSISAVVVGFKKQTSTITVSGKNVALNFSLEEDVQALSEVTVTAEHHEIKKIREQAFTVNSIDVVPLQNLNIDVNTVLNRTTGIRIRQNGGLGSDFNFSLNGFSGNQVRFFVDGISSDFLGSSMQFNNIPVNIIERIEVYKGVVPVYLGADALGGAVNIVTSDNAKDFLDVSYSHGSFNTHQAAISSRALFKKHFIVNASGFYNYSDNDFAVDARLVDEVSGKISKPKSFRLFNEDYRSVSGMIEGGVIRTKWADRFLIGLIATDNEKHFQRGRAMVLNPAGQAFTTSRSIIPTVKYQKRDFGIRNMSLNIAAVYTDTKTVNVDTSSRIYSWDRSYVMRAFGTTSGELAWYKTMFSFNDRATFNTATLEYVAGKHHTFTLNNTYSWFSRKGSDPVASQYTDNIAFTDPRTLTKNITGLSYKLSVWDNRWNTLAFFKSFKMNASVLLQDESTNEYYSQLNKHSKFGGGLASSIFVTDNLQLKTSYEYTTRLPENYELFGNGLLILPNMALRPERSHNVNFSVLYDKTFSNDHSLDVEGGFIYRLPENMIRLVAIGVLAEHQNLSSAKVMGVEGAIRYGYKRFINIEFNATYQDMRNNSKEIDSYSNPLYRDRVPNIPYLFGNAMAALTSPTFGDRQWQVGFNWSTMYVQQFYLHWPSQGDQKHTIPQQISHDASVTLSSLAGRYNVSFSCWNLADSRLYDNYRVQKPGRSFNVKLRFYLNKFKN